MRRPQSVNADNTGLRKKNMVTKEAETRIRPEDDRILKTDFSALPTFPSQSKRS